MICKNCGTETSQAYCPHCGALLNANGVSEPSHDVSADSAKPESRSKKKIHFGTVFWPAITLLIPLLFLYCDLFVVFSNDTFSLGPEGGSRFLLLMERLSSISFASGSFPDLVGGTYDAGTVLFETVSLHSLLKVLFRGGISSMSEFVLPVLLTAVLAICSAAMSFLVILTGGRAIRGKNTIGAISLFGSAAALSPLISGLILRLTFFLEKGGAEKTDLAMRSVCFSMESLLLTGLSVTMILPSISVLRRLSDYARGGGSPYVPLLYRGLEKKRFSALRAVSVLFALLAMAIPVTYFVFDIMTDGSLSFEKISLKEITDACRNVFSMFRGRSSDAELDSLTAPFITLFRVLRIPMLVAAYLLALPSLFRVLFASRMKFFKNRKAGFNMAKNGKGFRAAALSPFVICTFCQALLLIFLLLKTPIATHLDFSSVDSTLGVIYTVILYVRNLFGINTQYVFLSSLGVVLSLVAGNLSRCLASAAVKKE